MHRLTKQEQLVLCIGLGLLLLGWTVKAWRTAHPAALPDAKAVQSAADAATNRVVKGVPKGEE